MPKMISKFLAPATIPKIQEANSHENAPLGGYLTLLTLYPSVYAAFFTYLHRRRKRIPKRIAPSDLFYLSVATHKVSRLLSTEKVTIPVRMLVTEDKEERVDVPSSPERERPSRQSSLRQSLGELFTCPYCLGGWVALAVSIGHVVAPRHTRFICRVFVVETFADFMHVGFVAAKNSSQDP